MKTPKSILITLLAATLTCQAAEPAKSGVAPEEALTRLEKGNARFAKGSPRGVEDTTTRRKRLATGQKPFAIVLACADSRTPPELLFDQGLGDLFVVRVAGNILADQSVASIEYATAVLGSRLIVVLGHESCGAVKAARESYATNTKPPGHINSLVKAILPAVKKTQGKDLDATIRANVEEMVNQLKQTKPILKEQIESGKVAVVGGYYNLASGKVEFVK